MGKLKKIIYVGLGYGETTITETSLVCEMYINYTKSYDSFSSINSKHEFILDLNTFGDRFYKSEKNYSSIFLYIIWVDDDGLMRADLDQNKGYLNKIILPEFSEK